MEFIDSNDMQKYERRKWNWVTMSKEGSECDGSVQGMNQGKRPIIRSVRLVWVGGGFCCLLFFFSKEKLTRKLDL